MRSHHDVMALVRAAIPEPEAIESVVAYNPVDLTFTWNSTSFRVKLADLSSVEETHDGSRAMRPVSEVSTASLLLTTLLRAAARLQRYAKVDAYVRRRRPRKITMRDIIRVPGRLPTLGLHRCPQAA